MNVSAEERAAIDELLARYCWLVDHGEGEAWAALWTEDGQFTGIPDPLRGRDALRQMPVAFFQGFGGKLKHHITNLVLEPRGDGVQCKAYSMLTDWRESAGKVMAFAKITLTLVRSCDRDWKIQSLHADML